MICLPYLKKKQDINALQAEFQFPGNSLSSLE